MTVNLHTNNFSLNSVSPGFINEKELPISQNVDDNLALTINSQTSIISRIKDFISCIFEKIKHLFSFLIPKKNIPQKLLNSNPSQSKDEVSKVSSSPKQTSQPINLKSKCTRMIESITLRRIATTVGVITVIYLLSKIFFFRPFSVTVDLSCIHERRVEHIVEVKKSICDYAISFVNQFIPFQIPQSICGDIDIMAEKILDRLILQNPISAPNIKYYSTNLRDLYTHGNSPKKVVCSFFIDSK